MNGENNMETETPRPPILEIAWTRHANLDSTAKRRTKAYLTIRKWIIWLGVLATLFAIITQLMGQNETISAILRFTIKILLVTTPIGASALAAFTNKYYSNGHWLIYRAGAEEIQKEIYFFRTILAKDSGRRAYLEKRLGEIQRQMFRSLGGEFAFEGFSGQIPANYYPNDPNSDPGFHDLTGEEYFRYRLENQLAWHNKKVNQYKQERRRMTIYIILAGALGSVFAAWGGETNPLGIWVALTASITAALIGWQELRNVDSTIKTYSKVVMELTLLYDHWHNLEPEERTSAEFYQMVRGCEEVLWSQNMEYIKSMQEALAESGLEKEANLINRTINESVKSAERTKQAMEDAIVDNTRKTLEASEQKIDETFKAALGSLAEEASSELVQQELEAMSKAASEWVETAKEKASSMSGTITDLVKEFAHIDLSRDTKKEDLNAFFARLPKTNDVKG